MAGFSPPTFVNDIRTITKKHYQLPKADRVEKTISSFSLTGKAIFFLFVLAFIASGLYLLVRVSNSYMVEVPAQGGTLTEGVLGLPRFINPVLSVTDAGQDIASLVFSGLMRKTPQGEFLPDLAESYAVSEDGLTYSFILKEDATFHDGNPVTTNDIEFTIKKAQDPAIKSPRRAQWEGVTIVKHDERHIDFVLKQPYSWFLENATIGILPEHIWKDVGVDEFPFSTYNTNAIGAGPYRIARIKTNNGGIPLYYALEAFNNYVGEKPLIENIVIRFYSNQEKLLAAYESGEIRSMNSVFPEVARSLEESGARIEQTTLPRIFGIFFNQNQAPLFLDKDVKRALLLATDKEAIVREVLSGYGNTVENPLPPHLVTNDTAATSTLEERRQEAVALLEEAGWKRNEEGVLEKKTSKETTVLSFSISTGDAPELKKSAELLKSQWEAIGARVEIKVFESGDLNQNIIRPRKYDALLFGEIVNRDIDLFAFWHSSQRNDPGLNVALYANTKADKALESIRSATTHEEKEAHFETFAAEVAADIPAIFIYAPDFLYILPKDLQGFSMQQVTDPSERFLGIREWYLETDRVWKIFVR